MAIYHGTSILQATNVDVDKCTVQEKETWVENRLYILNLSYVRSRKHCASPYTTWSKTFERRENSSVSFQRVIILGNTP